MAELGWRSLVASRRSPINGRLEKRRPQDSCVYRHSALQSFAEKGVAMQFAGALEK